MKIINLEDREIQSLKKLLEDKESLINKIGKIEYELTILSNSKLSISKDIESLNNREYSITAELHNKYGDGVIDLDKGIIQIQD